MVYAGTILCSVQYVNSKGMLDLRSDDGEVYYGIAPSEVSFEVAGEAAQAKVVGDEVVAFPTTALAPAQAAPTQRLSDARIELTDNAPLSTSAGGSGAGVFRCRLNDDADIVAVKLLPANAAELKLEVII